MKETIHICRRLLLKRMAMAGVSASSSTALPQLLAAHPNVIQGKWRIGHHFWNWDRAWNSGEFLQKRLQLTKDTGYEGFEAKPQEIGQSAAEVGRRCTQLGIACAAIGGPPQEGVDYAAAAGASIVRSQVPKNDLKAMLDYANERGVIFVVHPHVAKPGATGAMGAVETREDLLRHLDEHPGVFACPDTGHLALCGSDPVQTIRDLGERCRYVHLKDIRPERVNRKFGKGEKFCELGTGALDLPGVIKSLEDIRYEGWIMVERDSREPDYVKSARNMRDTLRKFGY